VFKPLKDLLNFVPDNPTVKKRLRSGIRPNNSWNQKRDRFQNESFNFLALIQCWPEIIGPRLSKHTLPLKLTNRNLVVVTNHAAYSTQLSFISEQLKKKIINKFPQLGHQVQTISYCCNQQLFNKQQTTKVKPAPPTKPGGLHPLSPQYRELNKQAENLFKQIKDPEMKQSLISIYIQNAISSKR
jgi:hypothetical protein